MKNYVQDGVVITVTATEDMTAGKPYLVGSVRGVAATDTLTGEKCELVVSGVFDLGKVAANVFSQGQKVYLDTATGLITSTTAGNFLIGATTESAANGSTTCPVMLTNDLSAAAA